MKVDCQRIRDVSGFMLKSSRSVSDFRCNESHQRENASVVQKDFDGGYTVSQASETIPQASGHGCVDWGFDGSN
jgi:hypothetical protein